MQRLGGLHDRPRRGRGEHLQGHPETEREGEQVADSDSTSRGGGLVQWPVHPDQDLPLGELGQQPVDRLVEVHQALFNQG
jgi:hypothetical protein